MKVKPISVDYDVAAYPFNIGEFVGNALQRAARGACVKEELLRLPWFAAALAKLKHRHAGGEPSYSEKLKWLVEYGKAPERQSGRLEKPFNGGTFTFPFATFWNSLLKSDPKPETLVIIGPHKWITDAVKERRAGSSSTGGISRAGAKLWRRATSAGAGSGPSRSSGTASRGIGMEGRRPGDSRRISRRGSMP
jgi:hypothetical protein